MLILELIKVIAFWMNNILKHHSYSVDYMHKSKSKAFTQTYQSSIFKHLHNKYKFNFDKCNDNKFGVSYASPLYSKTITY